MPGIKPLMLCAACLLSLPVAVVRADPQQALMQLLEALHENGTIDRTTYELIRDSADGAETSAAAIPAGTGVGPAAGGPETVRAEPRRAAPTVELGGRIQVDAGLYNEDRRAHNDGTELRRVRLFARGELGRDWAYKLQYDFTGSGRDGIQDAYLEHRGLGRVRLRGGHFKEPFSLQNMTSSKHVTFIERGLPHVFAEGRNIGLQASTAGAKWSLAGGVFGQGRDGAADDDDEGYGVSGRLTYLPLRREERLLHLGTSASWRSTGSDDSLRFRERPESHVTDTRLVDTGTFNADHYLRLVAETAYVQGPLALQGEYYHTAVERDRPGDPDLDFSGYYAEASWFLSGDSLNYRAGSGSFGRVTPRRPLGSGGWGAWQLAARFSHLDLSDADIDGGVAESLTLGVNWYPLAQLRFSANYTNVLDVRGGPGTGDEPQAVTVRGQVDF